MPFGVSTRGVRSVDVEAVALVCVKETVEADVTDVNAVFAFDDFPTCGVVNWAGEVDVVVGVSAVSVEVQASRDGLKEDVTVACVSRDPLSSGVGLV